MLPRRCLVGAVLTLGLASAVPAQAEAPKRDAPATVIRDGAFTLQAHDDENDNFCLGLEGDGGSSESCGSGEFGVAVSQSTARDTFVIGAAVPAAATIIEVRRAGVLLASGTPVASAAYTGKRAGTLRFALVRLPAGARGDGLRVRAIAADGRLVAVLSSSENAELISDRRRVLSGRSGSVRWSLVSSRSSTLSPSVVDLGHETVSRCVELRVTAGRGSSSSDVCLGGAPRESQSLFAPGFIQAALEDRCQPNFRLLHGVVDGAVQRVVVLLGDGSRREARVKPVGDGAGTYALAIPQVAAVRSVTLDSGTAGSRVIRLGGPPLAVICATAPASSLEGVGSYGGGLSLTSPFGLVPEVTPVGPVTTVAGSPAIHVADGPGESLCVAVGGKPFTAQGCAVVSPSLTEVLGTLDDVTDPHGFALALPARVAKVRIAGPGGLGTRDLPTVAPTGYAGPYAGFVRLASATIADYRELRRIEYLDAAGNVLYSEPDSGEVDVFQRPSISPARRIAGRAGRPSLWQTNARIAGESLRCLALTSGPRPALDRACQTVRTSRSVIIAAPCSTHRLTVAVAVAAGTRAFAAIGRSRTRPIALRGGAGVLTLPSNARLRSLTLVRKGRRVRVRVDAPPAASQCGWMLRPIVPAA